uniref:Response regulator transcription factor n=1 Tax=Fundidesulfovibrio putealis TaxID=270496 RepID=A0A7C4A9Z1_9BACT
MRVLLVEDDPQAASYLVKGLKEQGVAVDHVADGREGLFRATAGGFDVIVLDRMLPNLDGLAILKTIRAAGDTTPVLVLSALSDVDARVEGLRAGGDDYLTKPFAFAELMARVEALGRRGRPEKALTTLSVADLELDLTARTVRRGGKPIDLKPKEFSLLEYFMRHAGQVVTRTMLLERVWDYAFDPQTNVIDVHVSRLRGKIDKDFDKPLLHTVRGAGYMLRDPAEAP